MYDIIAHKNKNYATLVLGGNYMFNLKKVTALALYFLHRLSNKKSNKVEYIKIIKLMYLSDREMIKRYNKPITGDTYACMRLGPVLLNTYSLISENREKKHYKNNENNSIWDDNIDTNSYYLEKSKSSDLDYEKTLTKKELSVIENIFTEFGRMKVFELVDMLHNRDKYPEWKDPKPNGIMPLSIVTLLESLEKNDNQINEYILKYVV